MGYVDAADDTNTIETDDIMDKVHLNDSLQKLKYINKIVCLENSFFNWKSLIKRTAWHPGPA